MSKFLTISNGSESFEIECTSTINTKVSEMCMIQLSQTDKIDPNDVVLNVLLDEIGIEEKDKSNWCLITS